MTQGSKQKEIMEFTIALVNESHQSGGKNLHLALCSWEVLGSAHQSLSRNTIHSVPFSSVAQSCLTLCHPMDCSTSGLPVHPPRVYSNLCPSCQWCHPIISSSVVPFSSRLQSFPASGSFQMSQFFTSGSQSIEVSASTSVLPMNTQDLSPLGWTGWTSLQSKGLSRVFSNTTVPKHQLFINTIHYMHAFMEGTLP